MLPQKLAFVDVETTGLSITRGRIIEIGILRVENNKLTKKFQSLVNPQGYVSPFSLELTGIKPNDLDKAPTFYELQDEIYEILQDCVFVAHNVRFDYGFIRNEFRRFEKSFSAKHFCTVKLFRQLYPSARRHNLDALIEQFNFSCKNRHRAFDDAKVLWNFWQSIQKSFPEDVLIDSLAKIQKRTSVPLSISQNTIDTLPEKPGVYIFYGEDHTPLYVGKSVNIRDRVLSHFTSDHTSSKEMNIAQQIKDIETIVTSGELGALIQESQLVKKLQPLYNSQLRIIRKLHVLKKVASPKGYIGAKLEVIDNIDPQELEDVIGIFRSKKQANNFLVNIAKEYQLCEKLLSIEKTKTSCFSYRLGVCKGACIGEEKPIKYNLRCIQAFSKNSIKHWPFKGPVVIREEDELDKTGEYFVVDKWCLLSQYKRYDSFVEKQSDNEYIFDVDTYKLLVKFLEKKSNWKYVKSISLSNPQLFSNI